MRYTEAASWALLSAILLLTAACGGASEPPAGAGASPAADSTPGQDPGQAYQGVALNGNQLINRGAAYSLTVPPGWLLYDQSTAERVVLQGPGVKVAFAILARPKTGSLEQETASLETALGASEMRYEPIDRGALEIGGLPAQRIAFRGQINEMTVVAENYVVQTSNITFILGFEAEASQRDLLAGDVKMIVDSIRFDGPASATPA